MWYAYMFLRARGLGSEGNRMEVLIYSVSTDL